MLQTLQPGRHFLQIPGPTNVPERVLRAIAAPTIDHRGPEFSRLARDVSAGLQRILAFMTAFPDGFDSLEHAADAIAAYQPQRRTRKSADDLRELLREGGDGRWRWHWDPRLVDELARDSEQHQDDIAQATRAVRCPLLLISGGRSDLVSARTVADLNGRAVIKSQDIAEAIHLRNLDGRYWR